MENFEILWPWWVDHNKKSVSTAAMCWPKSASIFRRRRPRASLDSFHPPKLMEIPLLNP